MNTKRQFFWTLLVLVVGLICMTQRVFSVHADQSSDTAQMLDIESPIHNAA